MAHTLGQAGARKVAALVASDASRLAVTHLRRLVLEGSDLDCYKINAFRMAEDAGVSRSDALRALLLATRLGICDLTWDVHCPSCGGVSDGYRRLAALTTRGQCELCAETWELDLEEQVEVTFTVSADVRPIRYPDFRDRDLPGQLQYLGDILPREGRAAAASGVIGPGETRSFRATLPAGEFRCNTPGPLERAVRLLVAGRPARDEQLVELTLEPGGQLRLQARELRPGPVHFSVTSRRPQPSGFLVRAVTAPDRWVSAAYVTAQQDFRELFGTELLAPGISFPIRGVTLLFTDIRGSTDLYEDLGDARAFAVVQEHFRILAEVIRRNEGCVVKTIGDAVMAAFPVNGSAVRAACQIRAALGGPDAPKVGLRLGLHRGPAIAVTFNRALDYFGRTVNLSARIQARSQPGEILVSDAVLADPAAVRAATECGLTPGSRRAKLRGIRGSLQLHSLVTAAAPIRRSHGVPVGPVTRASSSAAVAGNGAGAAVPHAPRKTVKPAGAASRTGNAQRKR